MDARDTYISFLEKECGFDRDEVKLATEDFSASDYECAVEIMGNKCSFYSGKTLVDIGKAVAADVLSYFIKNARATDWKNNDTWRNMRENLQISIRQRGVNHSRECKDFEMAFNT